MLRDEELVGAARDRSRRLVQTSFAALALASLTLALAAHYWGGALAIPEPDQAAIATAFLYLGLAHTATLFVWDWLFAANG